MPNTFDALLDQLLRAGVARHHADRYLIELREHFSDIVADEQAAGGSLTEARIRAAERLGTSDVLAQAMIGTTQFRAWSARAPLAVYIVAPVVVLAVCFAGAIALIVSFAEFLRSPGAGHHALPDWFATLTDSLTLLTAFVAPLLLGWGLALIALRQRAAWFWPVAGIAAISVIGAVAQLDVALPVTGGAGGEIAIRSVFLPPFLGLPAVALRAAATIALVAGPWLMLLHRARLRSTSGGHARYGS